MSRRHDESAPVLITGAAPSYDEEFAERKRRYNWIMAFRIPCLVLAGIAGMAFDWTWVAVALIVASVPLPWIAVLIANDRLPQKAGKVNRYKREPEGLAPVSERRIIEAAETLEARDRGGDRGTDTGPPPR